MAECIAIQGVHQWKIPQNVPLEGPISYEDLAAKCGVHQETLTRIVRRAICDHLFCEPSPGYVAHTADTRRLALEPALFEYVAWGYKVTQRTAMKAIDAIEMYPGSTSTTEAAFNVAFNTDLSMYDYVNQDPELRKAFNGMTEITRQGSSSIEFVVSNYPWQKLGSGLVVDIGGGTGHISKMVARKFKNLRFIVEDLPSTLRTVDRSGGDLGDRVSYVEHDFFQEQPIKDADAYFMSNILHNWSDPEAVRILRALTKALKPGAKVLCSERVMPEPGEVSLLKEREYRSVDLMMLALFNAKTRTRAQLETLFKTADRRFHVGLAHGVEESSLKVVEIEWRP